MCTCTILFDLHIILPFIHRMTHTTHTHGKCVVCLARGCTSSKCTSKWYNLYLNLSLLTCSPQTFNKLHVPLFTPFNNWHLAQVGLVSGGPNLMTSYYCFLFISLKYSSKERWTQPTLWHIWMMSMIRNPYYQRGQCHLVTALQVFPSGHFLPSSCLCFSTFQ